TDKVVIKEVTKYPVFVKNPRTQPISTKYNLIGYLSFLYARFAVYLPVSYYISKIVLPPWFS
ncbi:MAG TPA: hypothetical protein VJY43_00135, partial [Methanocorpusculum sp.]|nr:hypothetical protein [Methanocorpusculum sp.]